jgi:cytochrome c5
MGVRDEEAPRVYRVACAACKETFGIPGAELAAKVAQWGVRCPRCAAEWPDHVSFAGPGAPPPSGLPPPPRQAALF